MRHIKLKLLKILSIILCLFLFSASLFGQFDFRRDPYLSKKIDFVPDTVQKFTNVRKPFFVDSIFKLEKDYDFQFRFWNSGIFTPSTSVFILTQRNKKWSARYFAPNRDWQKDGKQIIEIAVDQSKLDQLWELLVMNDVLALTTQQEIKTPMVKFEIDTSNLVNASGRRLSINDGVLYEFELMKPSSSRHYSYHCPQTYLKYYTHIIEFYNASVIILLINKYLGLNEKGC